jgi:hypothetical protein
MREYQIFGLEFHKYQVDILPACLKVHMISNGSMEIGDPIIPWFLYSYLKQTLGLWRPANHCTVFDCIVQSLVAQAIHEYENCSWVPSEKWATDFFTTDREFAAHLIRSQLTCYFACEGKTRCNFCNNYEDCGVRV